MSHRSPSRSSARPYRPGWRRWIATCLLVAIAWPSTGALPWIALDLGEHRMAAARDAGAFGAATRHRHATAATYDDDADGHWHASEAVPGSPLHPDDHDCAECTVLKQLSGAIPPSIAFAPSPPIAVRVVPVRIAFAPLRARLVPLRPPVRAPPPVA